MDLLSKNIRLFAYVVLVVFVKSVSSLLTCTHTGECLSKFFCHTRLKICASCSQCSEARGNFNFCKEECFVAPTTSTPEISTANQMHVAGISHDTSHKIMVVVVVVTITLMLIAVGVVVYFVVKRCRRPKTVSVALESGAVGPSQMNPTETNAILTMSLLPPNNSLNTH